MLYSLDRTDTIYVIVDGDQCKKNDHFVVPATLDFELSDGDNLLLQGQYCFHCKQAQISRNLWAEKRSFHNKILAQPFLKCLDDFSDTEQRYGCPLDYPLPKRAEESRLKKYGYSVAHNSGLTDAARRELLQHIIDSKLETKAYVVKYLEYMIAINGKKQANFGALRKWQRDLEYVLKL